MLFSLLMMMMMTTTILEMMNKLTHKFVRKECRCVKIIRALRREKAKRGQVNLSITDDDIKSPRKSVR
jgi:hypothetical protein